MSAARAPAARRPALCALALWIAVFSLACRWAEPAPTPGTGAGGALGRAMGSLRRIAAHHTYVEADRYHHRGVGHREERAFDDPLQRLEGRLAPDAHAHLGGTEVAELLPWLRWTVRAQPEDVEAWRVAAYWLVHAAGHADLARAAYREAARANPGDYRIYLDWARLLLREGEWGGAARVCDRALALWPAPLPPDDADAVLDRARLAEWRGYLWAYAGETARAIASLETAAAVRPEHRLVRDELALLRAAPAVAGEPGPGLRHLREAPEPPPDVCGHPDHDTGGHADHGDHDGDGHSHHAP